MNILATKINLATIGNVIFFITILVNIILTMVMKNPIYRLLTLIWIIVMFASSWIFLGAEFLGFILLLVYAGIMKICLGSVLLTCDPLILSRDSKNIATWKFDKIHVKSGVIVTILMVLLSYIVKDYLFSINPEDGNLNELIKILLEHYNLLLVLIGIISLGAIIGILCLSQDLKWTRTQHKLILLKHKASNTLDPI